MESFLYHLRGGYLFWFNDFFCYILWEDNRQQSLNYNYFFGAACHMDWVYSKKVKVTGKIH
jgi:hypothetical protein